MTPEPRSPGSAFYDDPDTFRAYTARHTSSPRNPNHVMEGPAVRAAVGDVTGADVLDLGCGDARFGVKLLERGAASYLGVDGSRRMTRLAATTLADLDSWLTTVRAAPRAVDRRRLLQQQCPRDPTLLGDQPDELERRRRVPLFLLLGATVDRARD